MKKVLMAVALVSIMFVTGCATTQPSQICLGHTEDSLICQHIPNPLQADVVLRIANLEAIKNDVYTRQQAYDAINYIEDVVKTTNTYSDLLLVVNKYIKNMGPEILIVTSSFEELNKTLPISDYDRKLILIHLERQKEIIKLVN